MTSPTLGDSVATADDFTTRNIPSPAPRLSDLEARFYYYGLPSKPVLVARTGSTPWEVPTGPWAFPPKKQLGIVGNHEISEIWHALGPRVRDILDNGPVQWTGIDVVRIGNVEGDPGPVVVWIGIKPDSQVSYDVHHDAAARCKVLLMVHDIKDVEVEMRRSQVVRSARPQLLRPIDDTDPTAMDPTAEFRRPFTPTLGTPICGRLTLWREGTAGFFLGEGGESERLLLVTARHVVLPESDNAPYECKLEGQPRCDVLIFSDSSFEQHLVSIKHEIRLKSHTIEYQTARSKRFAGRTDDMSVRGHKDAESAIDRAKETQTALTSLHDELATHWAGDDNRVLGQVIFSPPIAFGVGPGQYTRDIAVVAVDTSRIDLASFAGNVIDMGFKIPIERFVPMMNQDPRNPYRFELTGDRFLRLRGTITEEEMRNPKTYDSNGNPCIMVLKLGSATDLTVGRANNIFSYTRIYADQEVVGDSMEWAILPYDKKSGSFSESGDSGSVVVDGAGRIGGLLTGCSGATGPTDVSYVTPIGFVLDTIREHSSLAEVYLKSGQSI